MKKLVINTNEESPKPGVAIIASVNCGGRVMSAVGFCSETKMEAASGDVVDVERSFVCDCGFIRMPWDSVVKWALLSEAAPDFDYRFEDHPMYRKKVIRETANRWLSRKAEEERTANK